MFIAAAIVGLAGFLFGVVVDDQLLQAVTAAFTFANTVVLVIHSRYTRRRLEPALEETGAIVRRKLGDRDPAATDGPPAEERRS